MKIRKIENCLYIGEWYVGWHTWKPEIVYHECGYEDGHARLSISLFGWMSIFKLPWKSKRFPDGDCDEPRWGVAIHGRTLWIYKGGDGNGGKKTSHGKNIIAWDLPFTYSTPCCRWQVECHTAHGLNIPCMIDRNVMECHDAKNYMPIHQVGIVEVGQNVYELTKYHYDYVDSYDGEVIPCVFWVEEQEWRPKWLGWTGLFKKIKRSIRIEFSSEVGRDKGSWKGGCIGCGYELLPSESPMDCIKRMEKERRF